MKRSYSGGANASSLTAPTTEITNILSVAPLVGWPDYTTGPFIITVDRGGVNEEKMLCSEHTSTGILVAQRGYDNTVARAHSAGETVEHTIGAVDVSEPNVHLNTGTGVHGLSGTEDIVGTEGFQTLINKTMDGNDNTFENIPQSAVVGLPQMAASAVPIGSIVMYAPNVGIPGNWLLCNGGVVSKTAYPDLWAAISGTYGATTATTFTLPDLVTRFPRGSATSTNAKAGAATKTLAVGELPGHQHGLASHTHTSAAHTHSTPALTHSLTTNVAVTVPDHPERTHNHGGATGNETQAGVMIATTSTVTDSGTGTSTMETSLPAHTHPITADVRPALTHAPAVTQPVVGGHAAGNTGSTTPGVTGGPSTSATEVTGSGTAFDILPPYIDIRFIIRAK
jgi:microcystin-dependent protein